MIGIASPANHVWLSQHDVEAVAYGEGLLHARWPATFPSGEGSDFAGIVTKVGPGVGSVKVGDEVIGFTDKRA